MNPLNLITYILGNKYVIMFLVLGALVGYHFYKVNSLENDIEFLNSEVKTITSNYNIAKEANISNSITIEKLQKDLELKDSQEKIKVDSYIKETGELKNVINSMSKKIDFSNSKTTKVINCQINVKTKGDISEKDPEFIIFNSISNIGNHSK